MLAIIQTVDSQDALIFVFTRKINFPKYGIRNPNPIIVTYELDDKSFTCFACWVNSSQTILFYERDAKIIRCVDYFKSTFYLTKWVYFLILSK